MVDIVPVAEDLAVSYRECLDGVAREKRYLAQIEALPPERIQGVVRERVATNAVQCMGQGIGRRLLRACMANAHTKGITRIERVVRADNERAIARYTSLGFEQAAVKRHAMRLYGVYDDAWQMSRLQSAT